MFWPVFQPPIQLVNPFGNVIYTPEISTWNLKYDGWKISVEYLEINHELQPI